MRFIVQGKVLSKVACHNERVERANRENKSVSEVPLKYGSLRLAVNKIELDGVLYNIDKASDDSLIKEERLILEISYRFDKEGNVVEDHEVINDIMLGNEYDITLDKSFVRKNHTMKLIPGGNNTMIRSYFFKAWANYIYFLDLPTLGETDNLISPISVLKSQNLDQSLILA